MSKQEGRWRQRLAVALSLVGVFVAFLFRESMLPWIGDNVAAVWGWLQGRTETSNWLALTFGLVVAVHAGHGALACWRWIRSRRGPTLPSPLVVHAGLWSWSYGLGNFVAVAMCPADNCDLVEASMGRRDNIFDARRQVGPIALECPLCGRCFTHSADAVRRIQAVVSGLTASRKSGLRKVSAKDNRARLDDLRRRFLATDGDAAWDLGV